MHYLARHGESRVEKAALISAVPPLMVKTPGQSAWPAQVSIGILDAIIDGLLYPRRDLLKSKGLARADIEPRTTAEHLSCLFLLLGIRSDAF